MATLETLQALQNDIGPRRAGAGSELRALEWLQARCEALGLPAELDEFTFIGSETYRPLLQLTILLFLAAGIILSFAGRPVAGILIIAVLFVYMNFIHKQLDVRLARTRSHNVIAGLNRPISQYVTDPDKGPAVLLCAHYDTPRNSPPWLAKTRNLLRSLGPLALLGVLLYLAFMALRGVGALLDLAGVRGFGEFLKTLVPWVGWVVLAMSAPMLVIMLVSSFSALKRKKTDSPGADDNGSGTALVLEVARRLTEKPPLNVEVFFAW